MKVTCLGGAGTVTGSKHLVESGDTRVLVDCGQFQGYKHLRLKNWERFPVAPSSIDAVALTHAHLDHSGALPILARGGFRGRIHATAATRELAAIILEDAANIQEEDARSANEGGYSKHRPARPLFDRHDAKKAIGLFATVRPGREVQMADLSAQWTPNGHILGSASVLLRDRQERVLWSGDLGRTDDAIMPAPQARPAAHRILVEGTYGDKVRLPADPLKALAAEVQRVATSGGILLAPAFAVGRVQALLVLLSRAMRTGAAPAMPIVVDSPMAEKATEVMRKHLALTRIDAHEWDDVRERVETTTTREQSMALAGRRGPLVLVSSSGMLTGGRVLHHLGRIGGDSRNTILLTGYQAGGTRGADLQNGRRTLRVHGRDLRIKARVMSLLGMSAHADQAAILDWLASNPEPAAVSVVHAEPQAGETLRRAVQARFGWPCDVAQLGQRLGPPARKD